MNSPSGYKSSAVVNVGSVRDSAVGGVQDATIKGNVRSNVSMGNMTAVGSGKNNLVVNSAGSIGGD